MRIENWRRRLQRGAVSIWMALGAVPLAGLMGFGVDLANVVNAQASVQNYVDAVATAGLKERLHAPRTHYVQSPFGVFPEVIGDPGYTDEEPTAGAWDFSAASPSFREGGAELPGVPAVHASIDAIEHRLLFGGLVGMPSVTLTASATAVTPSRQLVVVQDLSPAFGGGWGDLVLNDAKHQLRALVTDMADQDLPGDQLGLVAFHAADGVETRVESELVPLHGDVTDLHHAIQDLQPARNVPAGSSYPAAGIDLARGLFQAPRNPHVQRILVIVSDGIPQNGDCRPHEDAAEAAWEEAGIHVHSVFLPGTSSAGSDSCPRSLVQGRGAYYEAARWGGLHHAVSDAVGRGPVKLVE